MYEWQNKSELFLPGGFSIPFAKALGDMCLTKVQETVLA